MRARDEKWRESEREEAREENEKGDEDAVFSLSLSKSRLKWAAWGHRGGLREGGHVTARAAAAGGQKGYIYIYTHTCGRTTCGRCRRETHYHGRLCAGRVHPFGRTRVGRG